MALVPETLHLPGFRSFEQTQVRRTGRYTRRAMTMPGRRLFAFFARQRDNATVEAGGRVDLRNSMTPERVVRVNDASIRTHNILSMVAPFALPSDVERQGDPHARHRR
jgi:hypothetical protein